jgi:hypothetical protein
MSAKLRGVGQHSARPLRILYITYRFPPQATAESIQSFKFAKGLASLDHSVRVLTVRPPDSRSPFDPDLDLLRSESGLDVTETRNFVPGRLLKAALRRTVPAAVEAPDENRLWTLTGVSAGMQLCREARPDIIYSRAKSFVSHLVAMRVARRMDLPWVAHFSDPWVDNPFRNWSAAIHQANCELEREVVASATALVFVCDRSRDLVMAKYGRDAIRKCSVVPHAYVGEWYPAGASKTPSGRICLRHVGSLYGLRGVGDLVEAMDVLSTTNPGALDRISLEFVGHVGPEAARALEHYAEAGVVRFRSPVPYLASLDLAAAADCLLAFDALVDGKAQILLSKVVDYLPTRRRILAFTEPTGATARIVRVAGGAVIGPGDSAAAAAALRHAVHCTRGGSTPWSSALDEYSLPRLSRRLAAVLVGAIQEWTRRRP